MRIAVVFTRALACVVALAAVSGPAGFAGRGDVNGDRRLDVLDAQSVVAKIMCADAGVDVRDLQYILSRLNHNLSAAQPAPHESAAALEGSGPAGETWARRDSVVSSAPCPERDAKRRHASQHLGASLAYSRQTVRYLFTLTPHAPPA